jgi:hypothetical protein
MRIKRAGEWVLHPETTTQALHTLLQGLEEIIVKNKLDIYALLDRGSAKRRTAETLLNKQSSRSHSVFCVTVQPTTLYIVSFQASAGKSNALMPHCVALGVYLLHPCLGNIRCLHV